MITQTLEHRLPICTKKIKSFRNAYVSEEELQCRQCETICPNYQPYSPSFEVPINNGHMAFVLKGEHIR